MVLEEKLKALKGALKLWNNQFFGNLDSHIDFLMEVVSALDLRFEKGFSFGEDINSKRNSSSYL